MSECVLITGGAGFIGSKVAAAHAAAGDEVHVIVRPRGLIRSVRMAPKVIVAHLHLDDVQTLSNYVGQVRPTIIYHLASDTGRSAGGLNPLDSRIVMGDLQNFLTLLTAARAAAPKILVRAGSLAEYGNGAKASASNPCRPTPPPWLPARIWRGPFSRRFPSRFSPRASRSPMAKASPMPF
jgi:nucleoside-diphosphate-sugar epimerase